MVRELNVRLLKACGIALKLLKFLRLGTILLIQWCLFQILITESLTAESAD
jgi:hypothetical protein